MTASRVSRMLYLLAVAAYCISFVLPTFYITVSGVPSEPNVGFEAFYSCLVTTSLLGPLPLIVWLANPAFWVAGGLVLARRTRLAAFFAGIAILLGVWFIGQQSLVGYYVWLGSFGLLLAGTAVEFGTDEQEDNRVEPHQTDSRFTARRW